MAAKTGYTDVAVATAQYTIAGAAKYAVGGWVSGLYGGTVVIRNNGGDDLTLSANGPFTFGTPLASGASYAITIATQLTNGQTCRVDTDNTGSGTGGTMTAPTSYRSPLCADR